MDWLAHIFAPICSQVNCWTLDGETLPFCQRCTGLYVGATLALLGYGLVRPRPTPGMLWAHGLLLLAMVPFGYHLVPHSGTIRTLTGQLFAVGLVGYLSLLPTSHLPLRQARSGAVVYTAAVLAAIGLVQVAVNCGGRWTAVALGWCGLAGLLVLGALTLANLVLITQFALRAARFGRGADGP